MNPAAALLAPFLWLLPALSGAPLPDSAEDRPEAAALSHPPAGWDAAIEAAQPQNAQQVRIEQRVTVRIGPRPLPMPLGPAMFDSGFDGGAPGPRFTERKLGKCVAVAGIAGVQSAPGNRLLLLMRDRRLVTASLRKGCNSRDFYSGFLVSQSGDGMICVKRDSLLSRSGASCQVEGFRQLVPADE